MLTNNGIAALKLMPVMGASSFCKGIYEAKNTDGDTYYLCGHCQVGSSCYTPFNAFSAIGSIKFGSGTTAATVNDYCLEATISNSNYTATTTSISSGYDSTNDKITLTNNITFTNNSSSSITIGEIGYAPPQYKANSMGASYSQYTYFLLDRTVLSTPITVPAGDTVSIVYSLSFSYNF